MNQLLNKTKHSISELSQIYRHIKKNINPNTKWFDVFRKVNRTETFKIARTHNRKVIMKNLKQTFKDDDWEDKQMTKETKQVKRLIKKTTTKELKRYAVSGRVIGTNSIPSNLPSIS